jgi:hypothetical protein
VHRDNGLWEQQPYPVGRKRPLTIHLNDRLYYDFKEHFEKQSQQDVRTQVYENPAILCIVITYCHELAHVIQGAFRSAPTPVSRRGYVRKNESWTDEDPISKKAFQVPKGHSGDWLEQEAFGGQLEVYWNDTEKVGKLNLLSFMTVKSVASVRRDGKRSEVIVRMGESYNFCSTAISALNTDHLTSFNAT